MSDDNTDTILGGLTAGFLALCGIGAAISAWRHVASRRQLMKTSRSDTDLTNMLENAIPSASAGRRMSPAEDPAV